MTFGAQQLPAAIVLTFDNLGEASELERGSWPAHAPLGRHPSVVEVLPALLDELDAVGLTATFFVEAINCELYPDALAGIVARGHELGVHGWRHERWEALPAARERELLARSRAAFAALGFDARGFRPPGGALTAHSPELLAASGITWCSPEGGGVGVRDGLAYVPFAWPDVDAYHLLGQFEQLRVRRGDGARPLEPTALLERMSARLSGGALGQRVGVLILHPFLMLDPGWFAGVRALLGALAALARERRAWVVAGGRFAGWLRGTATAVPA
ncbi:MAG: polysaccharide deacetylase family protein [Solirubrobacteraceae bacterium]|jgi:peptidoglycan/xylan/chitin deacetylase (PgdA/CDA1 family)